ncbi:hypothetical protein [Streptomyces scabiei]|uniref:Uncharacterized protein n=1 Tax=Streptomyces scabiei TaxID=1930 RepID=A0A117EE76_STRSC|nr:hypothetical protein [Streptomyces scabiei]GAQ63623.1 hypothetical protein SsS58_04006 [Streptomyces scabiei]
MKDPRHRILTAGAVAVSGALSTAIGVRLDAYGVPPVLLFACTASCLATFSSLLFRLIETWSTTTHRCTRPGCDFRVSLTRATAADNRRWQEIAARHPHRN